MPRLPKISPVIAKKCKIKPKKSLKAKSSTDIKPDPRIRPIRTNPAVLRHVEEVNGRDAQVKHIALPGETYVIVDAKYYDFLKQWKWRLLKCKQGYDRVIYYTNPRDGKGSNYCSMHRFLFNHVHGKLNLYDRVIFLNGNHLDMRIDNLGKKVPCGLEQTNSKYLGVKRDPDSNMWISYVEELDHQIGLFHSREDAAKAYDAFVVCKKDLCLPVNFPAANILAQLSIPDIDSDKKLIQVLHELKFRLNSCGMQTQMTVVLNNLLDEMNKVFKMGPPVRKIYPQHTYIADKSYKPRKRFLRPGGKSSKYIGVSWKAKDKRWLAFYQSAEKMTNIGYFKEEIDAAKARDKKILELGLDKVLNFPPE